MVKSWWADRGREGDAVEGWRAETEAESSEACEEMSRQGLYDEASGRVTGAG